MKINISDNLLELAQIFSNFGKLFIVGGYVRNSLLGFSETDIDICSKLTPDKISNLLKNTKFEILEKSNIVGYVKIRCKNEIYEHSTFRKDNYFPTGTHLVESVDYVQDLRQDAMRRDFTINALYYDILNKKIIDIYSGLLDLKNEIVRCVEVPGYVLAHDGVRILRMIRIACELNFKIDYATYATARRFGHLLNDISAQRKFNELMAILKSPNKYPISKKKSNVKGISIFNDLHLWNSFFISTSRVKINMLKKSSVENSFFALLIDIIDTINPDCIEYFLKDLLGNNGFCQSTNFINYCNNIICGYYDALNKMNNKTYFFKYFTYFDKISELLIIKSKKLYAKYKFFCSYIKKHKLPTSVKDLNINGEDIKMYFPEIPEKKYNKILTDLLGKVFDAQIQNTKDNLLKEVENVNKYNYN